MRSVYDAWQVAAACLRRLCERMLRPAFRAPLRGGAGEEQYRRSPSLGNDDVSSRGSNDAGIVAPSWPSTPRRWVALAWHWRTAWLDNMPGPVRHATLLSLF